MKIAIILASTRPGRHSDRIAKWTFDNARKNADFDDVELLDLRDYPMPLFNESVSPRFNPERKPSAEVKKWLDKLDIFDTYIIVTPEYNHSIPAVLKNALDYIDWQVKQKPFAIVSHGSAGGARAAEHLKGIISEVRAVVIPTALALTMRVSEVFDENGTLTEEIAAKPSSPAGTLDALLEELSWYAEALKTARSKS